MATPLEGRAYVVTGSGRGIGSEVAKLIGSLGGSVVVNDPGVNLDGSGSDSGPAAEIAKVINDQGIGKAVANMDTVATEEGGENMIKQAMDEFGRLDGVIHVAGILRDRMVFNMTEQEWDDVVAVHLNIVSRPVLWLSFLDDAPLPAPTVSLPHEICRPAQCLLLERCGGERSPCRVPAPTMICVGVSNRAQGLGAGND